MKRVLIIDALNAYLRAYIVNPSLSLNGQPIGGIKGFFMILQKLVRESSPDEVMVIWDGPDGSRKRKTMDKNYKSGRKPIKLNRAFHNLTDDEELKNKIWQQTRLIEYLNEMPIVQAMIPQVEADDIIAYVSRLPYYKGWQKLIVSNDKDFMQVCDEETILLRPVKGEYLNIRRIVEQTGVHPTNMALARAIIGDSSDNLPGIRGVGFGTVKKRLSFLSEEKTYNVDDIIEHCESVESDLKFYSNIIEGKELIEHNYKMMQLYAPQMSIQSKLHVKESIETFESTFNKTEIIGMMREDGFGELNWEDLKEKLNRINYQYHLPQN